jgi:uncharacterized membrane protein
MARRRDAPSIDPGRLKAVIAVGSFGLPALFATLGLDALVAPTFVAGFLLLLPLVALLGEDLPFVERDEDVAASDRTSVDAGARTEPRGGADEDPIERLRGRYARGEIDDAEFERRVERLVETENLEGSGVGDAARDRGRDRERASGFEYE